MYVIFAGPSLNFTASKVVVLCCLGTVVGLLGRLPPGVRHCRWHTAAVLSVPSRYIVALPPSTAGTRSPRVLIILLLPQAPTKPFWVTGNIQFTSLSLS